MNSSQIIIPKSWTYFAHRTNTERWQENPFGKQSILVNKLMSVVTESDIQREINSYGENDIQGFNKGKGMPFEIRCLICSLPYVRSMHDTSNEKSMMLNEFYFDKHNYGGAGGQRHHSIPKGEELVVLGVSSYDEETHANKNIIWSIPKRFLDLYNRDVNKGDNRIIDLKEINYGEKEDRSFPALKDTTTQKSLRSSLEEYCEDLQYNLEDAVVLNKRFGVKEKYQIVFLKVKDQMNLSSYNEGETSIIACKIDEKGGISDLPGGLKWTKEEEYKKTIVDKATSTRNADGRIVGIPYHVDGHCEFANGLELSIAINNKKKMQIFECGKSDLVGKKIGSKTLNEIENEHKMER